MGKPNQPDGKQQGLRQDKGEKNQHKRQTVRMKQIVYPRPRPVPRHIPQHGDIRCKQQKNEQQPTEVQSPVKIKG